MSTFAKTALVTGAGKRLGAEIARTLAKNGFDLLLHCNTSADGAETLADEIRALGRTAEVLRADLSDTKAALALAESVAARPVALDLLVNNAAIFYPLQLNGLNSAEWDAFMDLNLKAPYLLSTVIGRRMKAANKGGAIINMACVSAFRPWRDYLPYSVSKAGLVALTTGLAKLLAPEVRVNAIAPGTVLPPDEMPPEESIRLAENVPLKRLGSPEDIAGAVLYLANATFVTGQTLCVDGGRSIV